jgi:hypothetical protein
MEDLIFYGKQVMEKIIMQMWMRREPSTRTLSAYF